MPTRDNMMRGRWKLQYRTLQCTRVLIGALCFGPAAVHMPTDKHEEAESRQAGEEQCGIEEPVRRHLQGHGGHVRGKEPLSGGIATQHRPDCLGVQTHKSPSASEIQEGAVQQNHVIQALGQGKVTLKAFCAIFVQLCETPLVE